MPLTWFDTTEVQAFSTRLVDDLHRVKTGGTSRGDKAAQTSKRTEKLLEQAAAFETTHRLNVYKKAKLLIYVRGGLAKSGWGGAEIEAIISQLLTYRLRTTKA